MTSVSRGRTVTRPRQGNLYDIIVTNLVVPGIRTPKLPKGLYGQVSVSHIEGVRIWYFLSFDRGWSIGTVSGSRVVRHMVYGPGELPLTVGGRGGDLGSGTVRYPGSPIHVTGVTLGVLWSIRDIHRDTR